MTNYEVGWKTAWLTRTVFDSTAHSSWKNGRTSNSPISDPNALTIIANAGQAEIKGVETDLEFAVTQGLTLTGGFSLLNAKLTQDYCADQSKCGVAGYNPQIALANGYEQYAPSGTKLPVVPKFKGDITARYTFPLGSFKGNVQGSAVYVGSRTADLRYVASQLLGEESAYTIADFSTGIEKDGLTAELFVTNAFDKRAVLDRYSECDVAECGAIAIYNLVNQPRTIGVKFGQKF